jgi:hypothetical protein
VFRVVLAPYRIAATPEPEGPDPVDSYEALLRRRAVRGQRLATAAIGFVAALSVLAFAEVPPARRAPGETAEARAVARITAARGVVANARRAASEEQAQFASAVLAVIDRAEDQEGEREPCPVALPEATRLVHGKQAFPLLVVKTGDRDLPSPSVADVLGDVQRAEQHLNEGRYADGILYANALANAFARPPSVSAARLRYDVVLVARLLKQPVRNGTQSFEPGEIEGRAFLYDFGEHRVVCGGDLRAASSRQVEYNYLSAEHAPVALDQGPSLAATLDVDLEIQTQRAIVRALHKL